MIYMTRCPKLDTIIEEVVKKDTIDEDWELLRLQNFFMDTTGPLVTLPWRNWRLLLGPERPD